MSIEIRPLGSGDADALSAFFRRNDVVETTRYFHPFPLTSEQALLLCGYAEAGKDVYRVALISEEIVALYMLRGWDQGYDIPSFGILVDGRYRGSGIGRRLTLAAIDDARVLGASSLRLTVEADNSRAVDLYSSLGFVAVNGDAVSRSESLLMRLDFH